MPDDPSTLRDVGARDDETSLAPDGSAAAPSARIVSMREVQRERLDAEAQRLVRLESQLANLQLILKTDQARLAIDRLRFAVHGLCGTMPVGEVETEPDAEPRRLVRVK